MCTRLKNVNGLSLVQLANALEVSTKTIQRDL
ncbi:HTH domain-containing protein [uncultured Helicobacter sp.]